MIEKAWNSTHSTHTTDSFAIDHIVKSNLFLVSWGWGKGKDLFFLPKEQYFTR